MPPTEVFERISVDLDIMGGKPRIKGTRVTVGAILGLMAAGRSRAEVLNAYPYLRDDDLSEALGFAAYMLEGHVGDVLGPVT